MKRTNLHMELALLVESSNGFNKAEDYSFWIPLMELFLDEADEFEVHCWEDEQAAVDEWLDSFPHLACRKEGQVLIVSSIFLLEAKNFIRTHYLNEESELKWFSVFLSKSGNELFSSEHYGTEFVGIDLSKEMEILLKRIMPKETSFHHW